MLTDKYLENKNVPFLESLCAAYRIKMENIKLYPSLTPSAPEDNSIQDESQVYGLYKINEIEQCLERDGLEKKFKVQGTLVR